MHTALLLNSDTDTRTCRTKKKNSQILQLAYFNIINYFLYP